MTQHIMAHYHGTSCHTTMSRCPQQCPGAPSTNRVDSRVTVAAAAPTLSCQRCSKRGGHGSCVAIHSFTGHRDLWRGNMKWSGKLLSQTRRTAASLGDLDRLILCGLAQEHGEGAWLQRVCGVCVCARVSARVCVYPTMTDAQLSILDPSMTWSGGKLA